jgi:iron complex transport system substrate-binding protein
LSRIRFLATSLTLMCGVTACSSPEPRVLATTSIALAPTATPVSTSTTLISSTVPPPTTDLAPGTSLPSSSISANTTSAPKPAARVVSLSPTATETLFAVGAGGQVVAVDALSSFPPSAPRTTLSSKPVDVAAVLSYRPDAVVVEMPLVDAASFAAAGVQVLVAPPARSLDDAYAQINALGLLTGHKAQAAKLVSGMQTKVAAIVTQAQLQTRPLRYFHERNDQLGTVTSGSFLGQLYALLQLSSIADSVSPDAGDVTVSSADVTRENPDIVFLADAKCCRQTIDTVRKRPGWSGLKAVTSNAVITIDDDLASRWGPRVVDLLQAVSRRVAALSVG